MGAYSNLDLEQQCGSVGQSTPQSPTASQAAQPQSPFASPFVSGAFSGSPFVSMAQAPAATQQSAAPAAPQQTAPVSTQSTPAQQPASQPAPVKAQDADEQQNAAPASNPVEQAAEKNIRLNSFIDDIAHPYVLFDTLHLRQIILNLLNNSMKYTPPGGQVTFRVTELMANDRSATFKIDIADTGHGMDRRVLEHIWDELQKRSAMSRHQDRRT